MRLSNKQATMLVEVLRATLSIAGLGTYDRKKRAALYNEIYNQQSDILVDLEENGTEKGKKMKPGNIYFYHHKGHKVDFLIVLLSSDRIPGWETSEKVWRCAQYMLSGDKTNALHGAQIVLHTESELKKMEHTDHLCQSPYREDLYGTTKATTNSPEAHNGD